MSWQRDQSASAGLLPVKGTWGQVRIGSLIQGTDGTLNDVWEVIDMRSPEQYDHQSTPWYLVRNVASGQEAPVPPRQLDYACTFMVPEATVDPEVEKPKLDPATVAPHRKLSDQDAIDLIRAELGGSLLAVADHQTGIIKCPPFEESVSGNRRPYLDHLGLAHGMDVSAIAEVDIARLTTLHGEAHARNARQPYNAATPGFPHEHCYGEVGHPFTGLEY